MNELSIDITFTDKNSALVDMETIFHYFGLSPNGKVDYWQAPGNTASGDKFSAYSPNPNEVFIDSGFGVYTSYNINFKTGIVSKFVSNEYADYSIDQLWRIVRTNEKGDSSNNILYGTIRGDGLNGLAGDDIYLVDNAGDRVFEKANAGKDTIRASVSYALAAGQEVETLELTTGTGALNLTGNGFANTLIGNAGANALDGDGGADTLIGHGGNDTYRVDDAGDRVIEKAGQGTDTVRAAVSYALATGQSIEILELIGIASFDLTGNGFANTLRDNAGKNRLDGGGGDDILVSSGGRDVLIGGPGSDSAVIDRAGAKVGLSFVMKSVNGTTTLVGDGTTTTSIGNIQLTGGSGNDTFTTLSGNDVLDGGAGNDVLTSGKGADTFVFSTALGSGNIDRITDFAIEDAIRLSKSVFKALAPGQLKAGAFKDIGKVKVDADDHILYDSRNGNLFYDADGSGKAAAVKFAVLDNKAAITHTDILIA